ncbi:MAG: A/G-specific adenine glycosylase, partial [Anaerolineales bacterium]
MTTPIAKKLLDWYDINKRDLPWRDDPIPYAVWVAEVMAQQTRLETVTPYFERWMARFPTIADLALASQQDALTLWEGLGYYSRARNLHKAAQVVIEEHGGELPGNVKALQSLPGIGRYTAGAIASLVFGLDEPVVDGNVKRVMARVFMVDEMVDVPAGERKIWALAAEHLPLGKAADYNQALMDLGAMVCLPNNPDCERCPLREDCQAYA